MTIKINSCSIEAEAERKLQAMTAHPEFGYFLRLLDSHEICTGFAMAYVTSRLVLHRLTGASKRPGRIYPRE
jgi:hypothetical protein